MENKKKMRPEVRIKEIADGSVTLDVTIEDRSYEVIYAAKDNGHIEGTVSYTKDYGKDTLESDRTLIEDIAPLYIELACALLEARA